MDTLKEIYLSAGIEQDVYEFCNNIIKNLENR